MAFSAMEVEGILLMTEKVGNGPISLSQKQHTNNEVVHYVWVFPYSIWTPASISYPG